MKKDMEPILINCDPEQPQVNLYFAHDWHIGSPQHDAVQRDRLMQIIREDPLAKVVVIGDLSEYVMRNSKGDLYEMKMSPHEQKYAVAEIIRELGDSNKLIGVVPGNHERNRVTKEAGIFPLYDACVLAGKQDLFRPHFAFLDIGVGTSERDRHKQIHYVGYVVHAAKVQKNFCTSDAIDGIDFMAFGHDHAPQDHPRSKLVYDSKNKCVTQRSIEVINCGSTLSYGGYAADNAYRPLSSKKYMLQLFGDRKRIQTVGFYTD